MPKGIYIRTKHWNLSEETKKKIKENNAKYWKGKKRSEETKRKLREANLGKYLSEAHKKKISDKNRGHIVSEETRRKISKNSKGRHQSEETKKKISKTTKKRIINMSKKERKLRTKNWFIASQKANPSSIEKMIWMVLDNLNIKYEKHKRFDKFHPDIYIPSKNLIIECNGTYWHNYDIFPEKKIRDDNLQKYCNENGYKLIWLWEDEIRKDPKLALKNKLYLINGIAS